MEVSVSPITQVKQTTSVCMLPCELVGIGVFEDQVPSIEIGDGSCLHGVGVVLVVHFPLL